MGLTKYFIPNGVQKIESYRIYKQEELTSVFIPETVQEISDYAFNNCPNLKSIQVAGRNRFYADLDGILYDRKKRTLICCPQGLAQMHLPMSVIKIDQSAFANCRYLKKITVDKHNRKYTILNGVLYEHNGSELTKLIRCPVDIRKLYIPESVAEIHAHAFEFCTELKEVTLPERVTKIEKYTFRHCHKLKHISLHSGITTIERFAFESCTSLYEAILPDGVKYFNSNAFHSCENLRKLVIPESVKKIYISPGNCENLNSIILHGIEIPADQCDPDDVARLIVRRDFYVKIPLEVKAIVCYQMLMKHPDNKRVEEFIQEFIQKNFLEIIMVLILNNQVEAVRNYVQSFGNLLNAEYLDEFIQLAIDEQKYEIQLFLTDLKYQRNHFTKKDWTL